MSAKPRSDRDALDPSLKDLGNWPTVDTAALDEEDRKTYFQREAAVRAYVSGGRVGDIESETGVPRQEIHRLLARCLAIHDDGRIWGFRGLVPYRRQDPYDRTAPVKPHPLKPHGGDSGALARLFERFPDIREKIDDQFFKKVKDGVVHESRIPVKSIFKSFTASCREKGLAKLGEWPFTTKWLGYKAIANYLRGLFKQDLVAAVEARYGEDAARKLKTGAKGQTRRAVTRPYERVQFDGHLIDAFSTILVPNAFGGLVRVVVERLWLLVIKDCLSRAVLGYHVSLNLQYSAADVLQCIKRCIVPWRPKPLTIPGLRYSPRGGFPSGVFPRLAWAKWGELWFDNAKANLAKDVRVALTGTLRCAVNAGPIHSPERRALLERFYRTLEENGFHRLPSTTGSGPHDPRRQDPEKKALQHEITLEHLEELLDVVIAQYNATPHAGIGHRSPLEMLEYHLTGC